MLLARLKSFRALVTNSSMCITHAREFLRQIKQSGGTRDDIDKAGHDRYTHCPWQPFRVAKHLTQHEDVPGVLLHWICHSAPVIVFEKAPLAVLDLDLRLDCLRFDYIEFPGREN